MSFQAMTWAVEQKVPALQKLVLLMLSNMTNHHTGRCDPRIKFLAEECGMSETACKAAISGLAERGLLTVVPRFIDSVQLPNQYVLNLPIGGARSDGGGSPDDGGVGRQTTPVGRQTPTEPGIKPGSKTNTPHTPQGGQDGDADAQKKTRRKAGAIGIAEWLDAVKAAGERPIAEDDPLFKWAQTIGLSEDLLLLAWKEFKRKQIESNGKQKDWRAHFRNAVKGNWLRLWWVDGDTYTLTTAGKQAQMFYDREGA